MGLPGPNRVMKPDDDCKKNDECERVEQHEIFLEGAGQLEMLDVLHDFIPNDSWYSIG